MSQGKGVKRVNDAHRSSKKPAEKLGLSMWRPLGIDRSSFGGPFLLPSVSPSNSHCQVDVLHREPSSVNKHVFAKLHPQFMHVIIAQLIHL